MPRPPDGRCEIRHSHGGTFSVCARELRHGGLCCPLDPPCPTCVYPPALVCAKCGEEPTQVEARTTARLGGTHLAHHRREGVVGMQGAHRIESCGPWVRADAPTEEGQRALAAWYSKRAQEVRR